MRVTLPASKRKKSARIARSNAGADNSGKSAVSSPFGGCLRFRLQWDMAVSDRTLSTCSLSRWSGRKDRCRWCDKRLVGRQERWCGKVCGNRAYEQHEWTWARQAALARDLKACRHCGACGYGVRLEVNHKKPVLGKHSKQGCWHHVSKLETLCHDCHVEVTKAQRKAGLFRK